MPIPDFVPKIRVLVVDDHPMMNESMCLALEAEEDMQVVGVAQNGRAAIEQALALKPDVIVMDLFLPDMDGIRATAEIAQANPTARVLVITSSAENEHVQRAIEAGAMAYIVKDSSREQFILGVRTLASGRVFLPAEIGEKLVRGLQENKTPIAASTRPERAELTPREREVLALLGEGLGNREIARRLVLSESTVRVHLNNLLVKLGLHERNQAVVYAVKNGLTKQND